MKLQTINLKFIIICYNLSQKAVAVLNGSRVISGELMDLSNDPQ